MSELIPCPFCGGKNVLSTELQDGLPFIAYCQCGAENEAENWNTRPIEDALQARIAELKKDNDEFRQLIRDWSIVLDQNCDFQLWQVESVRQAMLEINKERER